MNNTKNEIVPQLFGESLIRTTTIDGEPWFVAKDVCDTLGLENSRRATMTLETCEKITVTNSNGNPRAGIPHEMSYVSESGLYALIFKSRKQEAVAFRLWGTKEVLPNLRKRGYYGRREKAITVFVQELLDMGLESRDATKLALSAFPPLTRREQLTQELSEANASALSAPNLDAQALLAATQQGTEYRIKDLYAVLPEKSEILKIKTVKGRETALGTLMQQLADMGHFRRLNTRYATFERLGDKIVALTQ